MTCQEYYARTTRLRYATHAWQLQVANCQTALVESTVTGHTNDNFRDEGRLHGHDTGL
jgi:hypothetical protein